MHLRSIAPALLGAALLLLIASEGRAAAPLACVQPQYEQLMSPLSSDEHVIIKADHVHLDDQGLTTLIGSVNVSQNGRQFVARALDYSRVTDTIRINDESFFSDAQFVIRSDHATFNMLDGTGSFLGTNFLINSIGGRGGADRIDFDQAGLAYLDHIWFTTCPPAHEDWSLDAGRLRLNQNTQMGVAHNVVMRFEEVPFLYLPYLRFPLDNDRHSGFLYPVVGNQTSTGIDLRWPIYLNLAPNYDATITPRVTTRRGELLDTRARYLEDHGTGSFEYDYAPHDQVTGEERSFLNFEGVHRFGQRVSIDADFAQVTDPNFFSDFGGTQADATTIYLPRGATATYVDPTNYTVTALVQKYQPLESPLTPAEIPYERRPEIHLNGLTKNAFLGTRAGIDGDFSDFFRPASVRGDRLFVDPFLRWEEDHTGWFTTSQADFTFRHYDLSDQSPLRQSSFNRSIPQFSAGGGLRFDRDFNSTILQTLEPQVQYLYVPYHNQDDLPNFDTGIPDFDFTQILARNRFVGDDRISDANQISMLLTTRFIDARTGTVDLSASAGQIYRLRAPRIAIAGFEQPSNGASDLVGGVDYQFYRWWDAHTELEYSTDTNNFVRSGVELMYRQDTRLLDLAYRYQAFTYNQVDGSFSTNISGHWGLAGRVRYSVSFHEFLDAFGGVTYETCCVAIRGAFRRYLANINGDYTSGAFFQIEFKGLTHVGSGFTTLLPYDGTDITQIGKRR